MYQLTYHNEEVKSLLSSKNQRSQLLDVELKNELEPVLENLREFGETMGAVCGCKPGVQGVIYELQGYNFYMSYAVDPYNSKIVIYEFRPVSHEIDWKSALEQDIDDEKERPGYIPQIGDPHTLLETIRLINDGVNTSQCIGSHLGSRAKKDKDIARMGDYTGRFLIELGIVTPVHTEKNCKRTYALTQKGQRIADSTDHETRERLLTEALLGFRPIKMIIEETTYGEKELTKELVEEIIELISLGDCGGTTSPRRAGSLQDLVKWVTRWAGIPIRRRGDHGVQLYIPFIYAS